MAVARATHSWQRASRARTEIGELHHRLNAFARGRKLPGRKVLDPGVFANLLFGAPVARHPALHVRSKRERLAKHFFLFGAVRTPVRAIHLHLTIGQATCESVILVCALAVSEIIG